MKALVTGGAGFIGSHLAEALVGRGDEVVVIDDLSNGSLGNLEHLGGSVRFVQGSITDSGTLLELVVGCDVVFHLAAVSNVAQTIDDPALGHLVNATGTLEVFQAARTAGAKVVYSSSAAVYGDKATVPVRESQPPQPISPYGSQKLLGELYLQNFCDLFGMTGVSLRYFNVYGPRQRPDSPYSGVISIFVDRASKGETITVHGDGGQTRDFVSVHDVVRANLRAAEASQGHSVYNVCTGSAITILRLAETVLGCTGNKSAIAFGPSRSGDITESCGSPDKFREELGFAAQVEPANGLESLVTWYASR